MAKRYTDEFRRDAVRMATTSGLTRLQLSSDWFYYAVCLRWYKRCASNVFCLILSLCFRIALSRSK
jgi:hypothetical protein